LLTEVSEGRATVAEAADRFGVTRSTAYLWARQAREKREGAERKKGRSAATFVELVARAPSAAHLAISVGGAQLDVRPGFDADLLRAVVAALRGEAT
jgi:transposase-like protein